MQTRFIGNDLEADRFMMLSQNSQNRAGAVKHLNVCLVSGIFHWVVLIH